MYFSSLNLLTSSSSKVELGYHLRLLCVGSATKLCVFKANSAVSAILSKMCVCVIVDAVTVQQSFSRWQRERKSRQNRADLTTPLRTTRSLCVPAAHRQYFKDLLLIKVCSSVRGEIFLI